MSTLHSPSFHEPALATDPNSVVVIPIAPLPTPTAADDWEVQHAEVTSVLDAPPDEPLVGSVVWLLVLTSGQKVLGFVRSVLVCRWLDPFHVGLWGMAQAAMDTTVPLLLMSIPGSFSRYMEFYRRRGQLRSFLRWTSALCLTTFLIGITICIALHEPLARIVFGDSKYGALIIVCMVGVVPAAFFAFAIEFLLGARQGKTVSLGHFIRGILFTVLTVVFLLAWRQDVTALIAAYGLSFLMAGLLLMRRMQWVLQRYPADTVPLAIGSTVRRIGPAIFGCWAMDFLNNLFLTVDRYMLVHWSRTSHGETLAAIGNYEAALVFPLLLATVAFMAARLALPHLAKDWELGRRQRVVDSMNYAVQFVAIVLILGGWLLELLAPHLFRIALRGQFPAGQQILPLAVTFYIWMALSWVVMNYLWCVERTAWGALAVVVGLAVNIALNVLWVPSLGIVGAAQGTVIANAVQLTLLLSLTTLFGMQWRLSTVLLCIAPITLSLETIPSAVPAVLSLSMAAPLLRHVRFHSSA